MRRGPGGSKQARRAAVVRAEQSAARRGPQAAAAGVLGRGFGRAQRAAQLGSRVGGKRQQP
jgi:hypothetical protein